MKILRKVLLLAAFASASAYADKPQIQWNQDYDFSSIQNFSWRDAANSTLEQSQPFLHSRVVNAIEYELTGVGLTSVTSNPDVYVTYYGSTETEVSIRTDTISYGMGRYGRGGWGYYGYRAAVPITTNARVTEYERGTLVVDIWDAASNELVWRGTVTGIVISDSVQKTEKNILKAIKKMAKQAKKLRERAED